MKRIKKFLTSRSKSRETEKQPVAAERDKQPERDVINAILDLSEGVDPYVPAAEPEANQAKVCVLYLLNFITTLLMCI